MYSYRAPTLLPSYPFWRTTQKHVLLAGVLHNLAPPSFMTFTPIGHQADHLPEPSRVPTVQARPVALATAELKNIAGADRDRVYSNPFTAFPPGLGSNWPATISPSRCQMTRVGRSCYEKFGAIPIRSRELLDFSPRCIVLSKGPAFEPGLKTSYVYKRVPLASGSLRLRKYVWRQLAQHGSTGRVDQLPTPATRAVYPLTSVAHRSLLSFRME
ncbi:hypothetical protein LXA43DRAFT_911500 [Ganoderma leucocontextum]|nr:hypothetical protein LXA43DRAFT_911500 [Ganoderma leucocontextum]